MIQCSSCALYCNVCVCVCVCFFLHSTYLIRRWSLFLFVHTWYIQLTTYVSKERDIQSDRSQIPHLFGFHIQNLNSIPNLVVCCGFWCFGYASPKCICSIQTEHIVKPALYLLSKYLFSFIHIPIKLSLCFIVDSIENFLRFGRSLSLVTVHNSHMKCFCEMS